MRNLVILGALAIVVLVGANLIGTGEDVTTQDTATNTMTGSVMELVNQANEELTAGAESLTASANELLDDAAAITADAQATINQAIEDGVASAEELAEIEPAAGEELNTAVEETAETVVEDAATEAATKTGEEAEELLNGLTQ